VKRREDERRITEDQGKRIAEAQRKQHEFAEAKLEEERRARAEQLAEAQRTEAARRRVQAKQIAEAQQLDPSHPQQEAAHVKRETDEHQAAQSLNRVSQAQDRKAAKIPSARGERKTEARDYRALRDYMLGR
jgi:hypothetical protein